MRKKKKKKGRKLPTQKELFILKGWVCKSGILLLALHGGYDTVFEPSFGARYVENASTAVKLQAVLTNCPGI